jgi:diacylglycerol O-acyltransferase
MVKLNAQDASFLMLESARAPMHIGFLLTFKLPPRAPAELHAEAARAARTLGGRRRALQPTARPARGLQAAGAGTGNRPDENIDLRVPPAPRGPALAGRRARTRAGDLAPAHHPARAHAPAVGVHADRGPAAGPFRALHEDPPRAGRRRGSDAAASRRTLAESPRGTEPAALDGTRSAQHRRQAHAPRPTKSGAASSRPLRPNLGKPKPAEASRQHACRAGRAAFSTATALAGAVSPPRASTLGRVKALAKAADATVNDVVLALCQRRAARLPAGVRPRADGPAAGQRAGGTAARCRADDRQFGGRRARLARDPPEGPRERLLAIRDGMRAAKEEFKRLPTSVNRFINSVGMFAMTLMPKSRTPTPTRRPSPTSRSPTSPAPRSRSTFHGAELDGMYPVSVLAGDQRVNITVLGYHERAVLRPHRLPRHAAQRAAHRGAAAAGAATNSRQAIGLAPKRPRHGTARYGRRNRSQQGGPSRRRLPQGGQPPRRRLPRRPPQGGQPQRRPPPRRPSHRGSAAR